MKVFTLLTSLALAIVGTCFLLVFWEAGQEEVPLPSASKAAGVDVNDLGHLRNKFVNAERDYLMKMAENVKVGIAAMVTCSPDFEFWLGFHLNYLKIDLLVLGVEDCEELRPLLTKYGDKIHATFHHKDDIDIRDNYHSMMPRQNITVSRGLDMAKDRNVQFLFHIDADELLYVGPGHANLPVANESDPTSTQGVPRWVLLRKHLMDVEPVYSNIHMHNYEAVYPNVNFDRPNECFNTDKFLDCQYLGKCKNYGNGKSVARVGSEGFGYWMGGIKFHGPHYFTGRSFQMPNHRLAVLHFDSCTFEQYMRKFRLLAQASEDDINKIPFPFYKQTIAQIKRCRDIPREQEKLIAECEESLSDIYKWHRVRPYRTWRARVIDYAGSGAESKYKDENEGWREERDIQRKWQENNERKRRQEAKRAANGNPIGGPQEGEAPRKDREGKKGRQRGIGGLYKAPRPPFEKFQRDG